MSAVPQDRKTTASSNCATKLIQNLLPIFFSPDILATHRCGSWGVNKDIIAACIGKSTASVIISNVNVFVLINFCPKCLQRNG